MHMPLRLSARCGAAGTRLAEQAPLFDRGKCNRIAGSEILESAGEDAAKGVRARAADQEAKGHKQDGQCVLEAAFADVEAVRKVNQVDGTDHDGDNAEGSDTLQSAKKNRQPAGKLRQTYQIADWHGKVQVSRETLWSRAAKGSK